MKKIILIAAIIITGISFQVKAQNSYDRGYDNSYNYGGYDNDGFGYFYTSLSPYGSWIEFGDGVYGWRPINMRRAWVPYADGRWIWTSDGWYWDSYEPFGYIVYHYGRWYFDDYYGWVWIPDYQWAPAWVEWRYDNDYIGWAPLSPYAVFYVSIGIQFTHTYYTPYSHWHFVKYHYFCDPYVGKYYVAAKYKYRVYSNTKYRNEYGYRDGRVIDRGVDVNLIRERGKIDVRERKIRTVTGVRDLNTGERVTNNEVRTFIPDRNNFKGSRVKDVKVTRTGRNTTLETSKLEFGRKDNVRTKAPVLKKTETRNNTDVKRNDTRIQTERKSTTGKVDQNKRTEQKRVVPDIRKNTNQRNEVKKPVKKEPVKRETRTSTSRTETKQNVEKKTNEQKIQRNNVPSKVTRSYTPPKQNSAPVKVNRTTRSNSGSSGNSNVQRQGDSRTKSDNKRETNSARGRR